MSVVDEVIINKEGFRPVLIDFQNGKINSEEESKLETALYKTKEEKTVVGVTSHNMLYTGIVDENELYNNFLLIHDKNTDTIRLVQIDYCTVSPLLDTKRNLTDISLKPAENSMSELNKQFGSKRTKRYTEQKERLKMNISTVEEQLEKTVSDIKMNETDLKYPVQNENDSLYRPKINREASIREQVYNLDDLVPTHVLDTLSEEAENIMNGNIEEYSLVPFSSINISKILTSSSDNIKIQKITIFLYIHYLIKFINTPMKNITKKFVVCNKSAEVNNHILDNYSINTGHNRTRPLLMKDKALCFILVLAAIALDYEVDVEPISKDLRIGIKKVMEISKVLAFTSSSKNKNVIILKLPLPAPVLSSPKRKRK